MSNTLNELRQLAEDVQVDPDAVERLRERFLREAKHSELTPRPKRWVKTSRGTLVAAVVTVSLAGAASATEIVDLSRFFSDGPAEQASGLQDKRAPSLSIDEKLELERHAGRIKDAGQGDAAKSQKLLDGLESGKLLLSTDSVRISAAPVADGGICYVIGDPSTNTVKSSSCATEFNRYGLITETGPSSAAGIYADGVDAIDIVSSVGKSAALLNNNAFYWSGNSAPKEIHVTRRGAVEVWQLG